MWLHTVWRSCVPHPSPLSRWACGTETVTRVGSQRLTSSKLPSLLSTPRTRPADEHTSDEVVATK